MIFHSLKVSNIRPQVPSSPAKAQEEAQTTAEDQEEAQTTAEDQAFKKSFIKIPR